MLNTLYAVMATLVITLLSAVPPPLQEPNNKCCTKPKVGTGPPPPETCYDGPCFVPVKGEDHCIGQGTTPITPGHCNVILEGSHCTVGAAEETLPVGAYECDIAVCETDPEKSTCKWRTDGPTVATVASCSASHICP